MDPRMLDTLMLSWTAFLFFGFLVCWARYRLELMRRQVEEAEALEALLDDTTEPVRYRRSAS